MVYYNDKSLNQFFPNILENDIENGHKMAIKCERYGIESRFLYFSREK